MADEDLLYNLGADTSGLANAEREHLAFLDRFEQRSRTAAGRLPPLVIDTTRLRTSLEAAGVDVDRFFQGFHQGVAEGIEEMQDLVHASEEASQRLADAAARAPRIIGVETGRFDPPGLARGHEAFERGVAGSQRRAEEAREKIENLNRVMLQSGQASRRAAGDNEAASAAIGRLGEATRRTDAAQAGASRNANILRGSLTALALEATGTAGPLGRLASSALVFAAGSTAAVVGIGVVAALASAWRALTADAHRAKEAQQEALAGFRQRVGGFAAGNESTQRGAARSRIQQLQTEELALERELARVTFDVTRAVALRAALLQTVNERKALELQLTIDQDRTEREAAENTRRARQEARRQAVADELSFAQQELRAQESNLRAQFGRELITREQFYDQRVALARRAGAAETAALLEERKQLQVAAPQETGAQRTAREAQISHVDSVLALRERGLDLQAQEIRNEQILVEFAERKARLEQQRQIRLTQSGQGNLVPGSEGRGLIPTNDGSLQAPPIEIPLILRGAAAREQLDVIQDRAERAKTESERLANAINDVTTGLDDVAGAAVGIGLISEGADRGIRSMLDLGDAIADVIAQSRDLEKGLSLSSIGGLISTGLNVLGQVLGPSEAERALERAQQQNTRALQSLRDEVHGLTDNLAAIENQRGAVASLTEAEINKARSMQDSNFQGVDDGIRFLNERLERFGLTMEQLDAIAERRGLDLMDEKGRLVADAFEVLEEVLGLVIDQATTFGDTLSEREQELALEDKLGIGGRSADERVAELERIRQIQLENLDLGDREEQRIRGLDLSTAEGREAFRQAQIDLFRRRGEFEAINDGFETVNDFVNTIDNAADGINAFNKAIQDATRIVQGQVPEWWSLSEAEFAARGPIRTDGARLPLGLNDVLPIPAGGFPGLTPNDAMLLARTAALGRITNINVLGSISIPVSGLTDPQATAHAVREAFLRSVLASGGEIDDVHGV